MLLFDSISNLSLLTNHVIIIIIIINIVVIIINLPRIISLFRRFIDSFVPPCLPA